MHMDLHRNGRIPVLQSQAATEAHTITATALLDRIIKIRKAIDYRNTKIDALVARAENTSVRLSGMPHNPSADSSPMATAICQKIDLEREIEELSAERESLIAKIDLLGDDDLSRILLLRYAQEAVWDEIMAEMGYCHSHIFRLHRKAITQLDALLKNETKWDTMRLKETRSQ